MVVGITGASGTVYGIRVLEMLRAMKIESHLVISKAGDQTRSLETDVSAAALRALADKVYAPGDIAAAISSGSFQTMGMIVAPCSVRTLSEIATGVTSSLVARAADVCLKERDVELDRRALGLEALRHLDLALGLPELRCRRARLAALALPQPGRTRVHLLRRLGRDAHRAARGPRLLSGVGRAALCGRASLRRCAALRWRRQRQLRRERDRRARTQTLQKRNRPTIACHAHYLPHK
jgi:polyprenyl P-hydroxybenzoate/phenylacrylic acid decarboxylase-like protein